MIEKGGRVEEAGQCVGESVLVCLCVCVWRRGGGGGGGWDCVRGRYICTYAYREERERGREGESTHISIGLWEVIFCSFQRIYIFICVCMRAWLTRIEEGG